jgi:predicted regulator of Ras-like GTPase activity (Roadblock/LC7/MglB family)
MIEGAEGASGLADVSRGGTAGSVAAPGSIERTPAPGVSRARQFKDTLAELRRLRGILGGAIVTRDGLVITADLPGSVPAEPLAALAGVLGRQIETSMDELGHGRFRAAMFSADDGTVFVGASLVGFVVLVGDATANPEPVLHALRSALARLTGAWPGLRSE